MTPAPIDPLFHPIASELSALATQSGKIRSCWTGITGNHKKAIQGKYEDAPVLELSTIKDSLYLVNGLVERVSPIIDKAFDREVKRLCDGITKFVDDPKCYLYENSKFALVRDDNGQIYLYPKDYKDLAIDIYGIAIRRPQSSGIYLCFQTQGFEICYAMGKNDSQYFSIPEDYENKELSEKIQMDYQQSLRIFTEEVDVSPLVDPRFKTTMADINNSILDNDGEMAGIRIEIKPGIWFYIRHNTFIFITEVM